MGNLVITVLVIIEAHSRTLRELSVSLERDYEGFAVFKTIQLGHILIIEVQIEASNPAEFCLK